MASCDGCKYSCEREWRNYSQYGMSADCDMTCSYDTKTEVYVSKYMVCGHFEEKGTPINWSERRKRTYPVEKCGGRA